MLEDVDPGDDGLAAVGLEQGGQDAHGGGLAGAVGAEQAQHGAFGDIEVHAVQSPDITEGLDQTLGVNGAWHMGSPSGWGERNRPRS
ncbi:hypothetical protein GCM10010336_07120 [Streptomyces goshikiensis]|nr:hypothetical protein GCM10010336_07120 [Streptomyces goshikiensis]